MKRKSDQRPEKPDIKTNKDIVDSDNSNILSTVNSNIKHVSGNLNADDLYALPNKRHTSKSTDKHESKVYEIASDEEEKDECDNKNSNDSIEDKDENKDLPFGWEKHEDNDGPYYWHIKSGTIQREPPLFPKELITQNSDAKTPSSGFHQSPSLMHFQATSSISKYNSHFQHSISAIGYTGRNQVNPITQSI